MEKDTTVILKELMLEQGQLGSTQLADNSVQTMNSFTLKKITQHHFFFSSESRENSVFLMGLFCCSLRPCSCWD